MGTKTFNSGETGQDSRIIAGVFAAGKTDENRVPVGLSEWRIKTGSPIIADAVAELFGGTPQYIGSSRELHLAVDTRANTVPILMAGLNDLCVDMKLWNRGELVHHCDGVEFLSPAKKRGTPCGCPATLSERKNSARDFMGPSPSIEVTFRLADRPDLGEFQFKTGTWTLLGALEGVENDLAAVDGPALCELSLVRVDVVTKNGQNAHYMKPEIRVLGPAS
ncbi:hypothetical protein [Kitasatospora paranensis]|uniref:Uncharacterized protein n=1 Tax=Kitasatospora paranensis TaxID=258053 RepID=A0ABW2G2T1_9ACTN